MECPVCGSELNLMTDTYYAPHFGELFLSSASCECGFRFTDSFSLEFNEPVRYRVEIREDNLSTKVIRSTSGTVRIPEIGIDLEPGPASQGFITNLEGVLCKMEDVVQVARRWNSDNPQKVERCDHILDKIDEAKDGNRKLTLILEDPLGNSVIDSEEAVIETLNDEEASKLRTGMNIFSKSHFNHLCDDNASL
ncbi:MAG: ZPR1 zinc finger domain-containing protein [Halobacteriota archaeon]